MIKLNKAFTQKLSQHLLLLNKFSTSDPIQTLCTTLGSLSSQTEIAETTFEDLCKEINHQIKNPNSTSIIDTIRLTTVLSFLLVLFTELHPRQEVCLKTYEPIPEDKKISLSNGNQYDIDVVIEHITRRSSFDDIYTNEPYNLFDIALILLIVNNAPELVKYLPSHIDRDQIEQLQIEMVQIQSHQESTAKNEDDVDEESQKLTSWARTKFFSATTQPFPIFFEQTNPLNEIRSFEARATGNQQRDVIVLSMRTVERDERSDSPICPPSWRCTIS